jgi:hypothetical protein
MRTISVTYTNNLFPKRIAAHWEPSYFSYLSLIATFLMLTSLFPMLNSTNAQTVPNGSGREFFLTSFKQCPDSEPYGVPDSVIVYIVGTEACTGYAKNFVTGYHLDFSVTPNQTTEIRIPATEAQCADTIGIQHKAIYINTTKNVWVYMQPSSRHCEGRNDTIEVKLISGSKISILPIPYFDDEILVDFATYRYFYHSQPTVSIIAVEDNTQLLVHVPIRETIDTTISVSIDQGEIYSYRPAPLTTSFACASPASSNCKPIIAFYHDETGEYLRRPYQNLATRQLNYAHFFSQEVLHLAGSHLVNFLNAVTTHNFIAFSMDDNAFYSINGQVPNQTDPPDGPHFPDGTPCITEIREANMPYNDLYPRFITANAPFHLVNEGHAFYPRLGGFFPHIPNQYDSYMACMGFVNFVVSGFPEYVLQTDRMVGEALFTTKAQLSPNTDSLFTELNIAVTDAGRFTTYINGSLISSDSFHSITECPYYYARFYYLNNAPELFHLQNSNGIVASLNQFGYYVVPMDTCSVFYFSYFGACHSGGNGAIKASLDALDLTPVWCSNDTLHLKAINNYYHYRIDWIIGDNYYPNREEILFPLVDSGLLKITLIIDKACPDTIIKYVTVIIPPIIVNMPKDTVICEGQSIRVHSPNTDIYRWADGTVGATLTPTYSGLHTLTASNYCYSVDSAVSIKLLDCSNDIYIPNAFTPERNGLNEEFRPLFTRPEQLEEYKLIIYNRWGGLEFYTTQYADGWTGYGCSEGVYVYIIEYKNKREKTQQQKGTVILIR